MPYCSFSLSVSWRAASATTSQGRRVRHLDARLLEEVLAIHDHGRLAVERRGVELVVHREAGADGRQDVVGILDGFQRLQPALCGPNRDLVGADRHDVELTTLRGDVLRDALAKDVLLQRHPFQLDVGVLCGEVFGQTLHADHVAIVHGGDGDGLSRGAGHGNGREGERGCARKKRRLHGCPPRHECSFYRRRSAGAGLCSACEQLFMIVRLRQPALPRSRRSVRVRDVRRASVRSLRR